MNFEFSTASQIVFGPGRLRGAAGLVKGWGDRALIVTGRDATRASSLLADLKTAGVATATFSVANEPSIETISEGIAAAREHRTDFVVGFGGGSVIDSAKAIAGLLTNPGTPLDYLEVIGGGKPLERPAAPWMAIPTTAGTGAEVTRNAVLSVPEKRLKVSLRSPHLLARVALVDPELTYDLPAPITAVTGMDALTQLIEPYVCNRATPMTDALCAAGIPRAARALASLAQNPRDNAARADLSLAALWSGIALANAGLGTVHGFAGVIGGRLAAAHGAVCAALLAPVMRANLVALRARASESAVLARYVQIARWLTGSDEASADDGVRHVKQLVSMLRIPRVVVPMDLVPEIVAATQSASSTKANPIALSAAELEAVLRP